MVALQRPCVLAIHAAHGIVGIALRRGIRSVSRPFSRCRYITLAIVSPPLAGFAVSSGRHA